MTTATTTIRPPFFVTTEHLFTPLVWVKPDGDKWTVEVDWAGSFQYSFDTSLSENVDGPLVDIDATAAGEALDRLVEDGLLPRGDAVASIKWVGEAFDPDPIAYYERG